VVRVSLIIQSYSLIISPVYGRSLSSMIPRGYLYGFRNLGFVENLKLMVDEDRCNNILKDRMSYQN
jgi:hypothetical protein